MLEGRLTVENKVNLSSVSKEWKGKKERQIPFPFILGFFLFYSSSDLGKQLEMQQLNNQSNPWLLNIFK